MSCLIHQVHTQTRYSHYHIEAVTYGGGGGELNGVDFLQEFIHTTVDTASLLCALEGLGDAPLENCVIKGYLAGCLW